MSKDYVKALSAITQAHISNTDLIEDEYIRGYIKGVKDALQLIVDGGADDAGRHSA